MKVTVARDGKRLILKALTKATTHHAELQMISAKSMERTDTVLEEILEEFNAVFQEPTELPPKRMIEHQIDLYPGAIPNKQAPYRYTHAQKAKIKTLVKEILEARIIRPSQSSFSSLVLLDKKKDGTWRMCVDYSKPLEEHHTHLRIALNLLRQNKLYAKRSKCSFGKRSVEYFGHVISAKGIATDPSKFEGMLTWPTPKDVKGLREFLGLTGY
ncbi:UNVERIFIED_CONTAM: Transposon Ty3-G Gag-Pol polyprotein [Sesamum angustifolium]|uniref:Transposon Ty3-G Gag-Pol polyprotein n=1 Tax=Sesamum angustifolium TaxID=2727405 RepID=A0AAW2M6L0_9LAMI